VNRGLMAACPQKSRKLWTDESMHAAVISVTEEGKGLRESARLYNVPVETLRRRTNGTVSVDCKPGPATVLSKEEEDKLCEYLIMMADMGYGLTRETVMHSAFVIAEKFNKKHPFTGDSAGRSWFDGFRKRHPMLTIRTPQPLSHCRALSANPDVIRDFFGKLGAIFGRLNLLSKPMQIYNCDESGISIVHCPGRVVMKLGRRTVYSLTSAEKGRTHTVVACVSATGFVLPPLMVYPRKRPVPDNFKEGAVPNTSFHTSENGWINSNIFLEWLKFFVANIPPTRPVLLIQDGHISHVSIEAIEFARANHIHLLCLPSHTTHILQPLDVGVFKSFKANFNKACSNYMAKYPGRVVTNDKLAALVADAWPHSFTTLNILSGFKKCGLFPFNPSAVDDRRLAPSKPFCVPQESTEDDNESLPSSPIFTEEQEKLYTKRFEEGFDIRDPNYEAWIRINHPFKSLSVTS
uniref:HTH CENPB-type domain-containing protein n=3 Tax=Amphimedon queenslandica TaxID=400682 RepID=A0A1X7SKR4_AMPQE